MKDAVEPFPFAMAQRKGAKLKTAGQRIDAKAVDSNGGIAAGQGHGKQIFGSISV